LFDLERLEVARGPQPILFGKNSIAGAVSMTTAKPTREFDGSVAILFEPQYGEENLEAVVSGPLSDGVAARLSVLRREFDGYMTNVHLNRKEEQRSDAVVRASFEWLPNDRWNIDFKMEHAEFDTVGRNDEMVNSIALPGGVDYITALNTTVARYNGAVAAGLAAPPPIPYTPGDAILNFVKSSGTDEQQNDVDNFTVNARYTLGDHTLTFVSGKVKYDFFQLCDCDFVSAPVVDGTSTTEEFDQFSQEIRLTSPSGAKLEYIAGLYYQTSTLNYFDKINVPPDGVLRAVSPALANIDTRRSFEQNSHMWSLFGQATWSMSRDLRLSFGGRYTTENKDATRAQTHYLGGVALPPTDPSGVTPNYLWGLNPLFGTFLIEPYKPIHGERKESRFTPSLTLQWDVSNAVMLYGTYVTGFKAGGFDVRSNGHPDPAVVNALNLRTTPPTNIVGVFEFEDEQAKSVEIGAKANFADHRAELNLALYQTGYHDLQTTVFDGTLGFNVANAARATIQGVEVDGRWAATDQLTLSASVGYLDFVFDEFPVAQCYFNDPRPVTGPGRCDAAGGRKEYTPEWTAALGAKYSHPVGARLVLRGNAELIYSGDYIWSPTLDPVAKQNAFTKVNLRLALGPADRVWEVALLGRNLTDERVSTFGGNATLAALLTRGTGNAYYTFVDPPRTWALQATYRFGHK
jgi:iron complex outermembrane recepter protein